MLFLFVSVPSSSGIGLKPHTCSQFGDWRRFSPLLIGDRFEALNILDWGDRTFSLFQSPPHRGSV